MASRTITSSSTDNIGNVREMKSNAQRVCCVSFPVQGHRPGELASERVRTSGGDDGQTSHE